ncbi:MAG: chaperone NapD [Planctomyces sp.]|nr:chaperone NapD [Planctomyces sp.]
MALIVLITSIQERKQQIPEKQYSIMIASLVVTLDRCHSDLHRTMDEIASLPGVEVPGPEGLQYRIPILIDSSCPDVLEERTRQLQQIPGVAFVDVVFVHFEDESGEIPGAPSERPTCHEL